MSTTPTPSLAALQIKATIELLMQPANVMDMNTLWLKQASGPIALLGEAVADQSATSFVFQQPAAQSIVGRTLLIENEPVVVTALSPDGLTATVERWRAAFPFMEMLPNAPKDAHAPGAGLLLLQYDTPWDYIAQRYFLPAFQQEVLALGPLAATFGTVASGSLGLATT